MEEENTKKENKLILLSVLVAISLVIGALLGGIAISGFNNPLFAHNNKEFALSDSDKNFIINVALQAPTYSDWCIMNGGTWMPTNQKEEYLPITKQEAGQLMQQGKEPIQDSNGNYYATILTVDRVCGVMK